MAYTTKQLETNAASLHELLDIEKRKRQHNKEEAIKLLVKDIALQQRKQPVKRAPVKKAPAPKKNRHYGDQRARRE